MQMFARTGEMSVKIAGGYLFYTHPVYYKDPFRPHEQCHRPEQTAGDADPRSVGIRCRTVHVAVVTAEQFGRHCHPAA